MRIYCTIFNGLYLVRGIALFRSLARHGGEFRLYAFAMDDDSAETLESLNDARLVVVRPAEFEDPELLRVKAERSIGEYYWTCTPSILLHCLRVRQEAECTYVDADIWFHSSPEPLFAEMGTKSILLTEHRYTPRHDQSVLSGLYCVQFMRFVADEAALTALGWWRERCIEWCYARREDGKFGDQKYLDDWPTRFPSVHVLANPGGGVAPWNIENHAIRSGPAGTEVSRDGSDWAPLVFYHYHGMRSYGPRMVCMAFGYRLSRAAKTLAYAPYLTELQEVFLQIGRRLSGPAAQGVAQAASNDGGPFRSLLRRIYGFPNTTILRDR